MAKAQIDLMGVGGGSGLKVETGTATITSQVTITLNKITNIKAIVTCMTNGTYKTFGAWSADSFDATKVLDVQSYTNSSNWGTTPTNSGGLVIPSSVSGNTFALTARANAQYGDTVEWFAIGE